MSQGGPVQVRHATMADARRIAAFNAALAKETESRELVPPILRSGVEALLRDPQKGWYAVAESGGDVPQPIIVGQVLITYEWSDWRNGSFWWLQSLYVEPAYRRQGTFRRLYDYVYEQACATSEQVCGLRLYVERDNEHAQDVYTHLGFQETPYKMLEMSFAR